MRTVQSLIDECVRLCGGQSALARKIGVFPQDVQAMQRGNRPISPETVGLLCDLLELDGEEARRLAVHAIVDRAPPEKQGVLRRAFFVSWAIGAMFGVAGWTTPADARSMTATAHRPTESNDQLLNAIAITEGKPNLTAYTLSTFLVETSGVLSRAVHWIRDLCAPCCAGQSA